MITCVYFTETLSHQIYWWTCGNIKQKIPKECHKALLEPVPNRLLRFKLCEFSQSGLTNTTNLPIRDHLPYSTDIQSLGLTIYNCESDDEDCTHLIMDKPTLCRFRLKVRIQGDEEFRQEKNDILCMHKHHYAKLQTIKVKIAGAENNGDANVADLQEELRNQMKEMEEVNKRKEEFERKEKRRPCNIDSICKDLKAKTLINTLEPKEEAVNEKDVVDRMKAFVDKYDTDIKIYGRIQKVDDIERYLLSKSHLVCEDTVNQMVIWCINLAVEEKIDLMKYSSHQCIVIQFILELAKSLKCDPRDCIEPFFTKFRSQEPEYQAAFNSQLEAFRERVKERANIRFEEALARIEEKERQKRLGPGGLDPVEVFANLPPELKKCFEQRNSQMFQETLGKMDPEVAEKHLKDCIASGLYAPRANKKKSDADDGSEEEKEKDKEEEAKTVETEENGEIIYEECGDTKTDN